MLHVAWVGDSQAMLFRRGQGVELVNPHKPDREVHTHVELMSVYTLWSTQDERERIEELGGMVIWLGAWRVNGNLSVSRAIGDAKDKKFITGAADTVRHCIVLCKSVLTVASLSLSLSLSTQRS